MKKIAVTGYYGTGSSAVIDLLSEIEGVACALGNRYEHTNFNCAGGLFDLEARLFHENANYYTRDIALNDFYNEMFKQYNNNFGWYGSYKKLFGKTYWQSVEDFMKEISLSGERKSLAHTTKRRFSLVKASLQIAAKVFWNKKHGVLGCKYVYDGEPQRYLIASHQEFLSSARLFIKKYFDYCQVADNDMVYDHLLFPEQCNVVERFFDDDFKLIIVDRDPRDIFVSDKYFWSTVKFGFQKMPMPRELNSFCSFWKKMHDSAMNQCNQKNILYVRFEDLVYNYERTVDEILKFCDIKSDRHIRKKEIFDPNKSIENTQVFNMIDESREACAVIEEQLPELIYDFPYSRNGNRNAVFDN